MQHPARATFPVKTTQTEPSIFRLLRELGEGTLFTPYVPHRH